MAGSRRGCRGGSNGNSGDSRDRGGRANDGMCAVKTGIACGESAEVFPVAKSELGFEVGNSPLNEGLKAKLFSCGGKEAGLFKHCKRECHDGDVRNGTLPNVARR